MSSRFKKGSATTEAARRQLMQPVTCWEKQWLPPEHAPSSSVRILRWVKSDKIQQFNDEEGDSVDQPLVPLPDLPDEPEVGEGEDEMEQDEQPTVPGTAEVSEQASVVEAVSRPPSPKTQLTMSLPSDNQEGDVTLTTDTGGLDVTSLQPMDPSTMDAMAHIDNVGQEQDGVQLEMTNLGPDGLVLESGNDLSQLEPDDAILGGPLMDNTADPFAENNIAESLPQ